VDYLVLLSFPSRRSSDLYFSSADNISTDGKYLLNNSVNENDASVARNVGFALVEPGKSTPVTLNQAYTTSIMGTSAAPDSETLRSEEHTSELQSRENLVC